MSVNIESGPNNMENYYKIKIRFGVRSNRILKLKQLSTMLQTEPTLSYVRGERYQSKRGILQRPWSFWAFDSTVLIRSDSPEEHALAIISRFEPVHEVIQTYLHDEESEVICHVTNENEYHGGFDFSSDTMARLSRLCNRFTFTFISTASD
jgi:hypothetical protein